MIAAALLFLIGIGFIAYSIIAYVRIKNRLKQHGLGRNNNVDVDHVTMRGVHRPYSVRDVKAEEFNYN